ncbi:MAG TPA: YeeE/YedE family protein [Burkholderiaceae bacterium]|nr:YeeE/YedE family protein [Burkholderiaceae bacterium]
MDPVSPEALPALTRTVLASAFALAFVFGAVAQRAGFCTMGAVADWVNFGDTTRMRQWLLAIATAIFGTQLLAAAGLIDTADSIYTGTRFTWLAYLAGGLCFGFGMVLAGGCGSRTLVRAGAGSLKSVVVFLVLGLSAYVTLRGALALVRAGVVEPVAVHLPVTQDLPALLARAAPLAPATAHAVLGVAFALAIALWALRDPAFRTRENVLSSAAIGAVIVGVWFVSGHIGHLEEHPLTLEEAFVGTATGRMESLTFVAPIAHTLDWLMFASDRSKTITLGVAAVLGTVAGSAAHALASGRFRWEGFADTEDTANHLVGGVLMGFGGVTALGCTIGQGLSGLSTLALGSFIAFGAIVAGAVLGLKYQTWRVARAG